MTITYHARQRMRQRDITEADIQKAICIGRRYRIGKYIHFRVGPGQVRQLPEPERRRLDGLAVICAEPLFVLTTYRHGDDR